MELITPTTISLLSLVISIFALLISFLNYHRDKYEIVVALDLETGKEIVNDKVIAEPIIIIVTNIGRRSVFITSVGLCIDDDKNIDDLLSPNGYKEGVKLEEGSKPIVLRIRKETVPKLKENWKEVYATASDSKRTYYVSNKIKRKL